jgi:hypothetical protein
VVTRRARLVWRCRRGTQRLSRSAEHDPCPELYRAVPAALVWISCHTYVSRNELVQARPKQLGGPMHKSAATYALIAMMTLGDAAFAQDKASQSPKQTTDRPQNTEQARREAPIGHRQPRAADVPLKTGIAPTPEEGELDRKLNICRNC